MCVLLGALRAPNVCLCSGLRRGERELPRIGGLGGGRSAPGEIENRSTCVFVATGQVSQFRPAFEAISGKFVSPYVIAFPVLSDRLLCLVRLSAQVRSGFRSNGLACSPNVVGVWTSSPPHRSFPVRLDFYVLAARLAAIVIFSWLRNYK